MITTRQITGVKSAVALAALLLGSAAMAAPIVVNDNYIGSEEHGYGDVIGDVNLFGIDSATLNIFGNTLTVVIQTNFVKTSGGIGSFSGYTRNYGDGDYPGISLGDLFLADEWTPFTDANSTEANGYKRDNQSNGTNWDYGFSINASSRKATSGGSGVWYDLQGDTQNSAILSTDSFLSGAIYRNGQAVAVNRDASGIAQLAGNSTAFSVNQALGQITFSLNLTGTSLENAETIGFHWDETCGNDVIEGKITRSVPEPTQLSLFGLALAALAYRRKRRAA